MAGKEEGGSFVMPLETIPDAIHIPVNEIRNRMSDLPKENLIVLL
jgi:rhodanese-related sulfurtransferase